MTTGDDWRTPPPAPAGQDVHTRSVIEAVSELAHRVGQLVDIITRNDTARRWIVGLLAANLVVLLVIAAFGRSFIVSSNRSRTILIECTTRSRPGDRHECFEDNQASQASAIAAIVDTNHNGIADTLELLANQTASARERGIDLPYPQLPPPSPTTTSTSSPHR